MITMCSSVINDMMNTRYISYLKRVDICFDLASFGWCFWLIRYLNQQTEVQPISPIDNRARPQRWLSKEEPVLCQWKHPWFCDTLNTLIDYRIVWTLVWYVNSIDSDDLYLRHRICSSLIHFMGCRLFANQSCRYWMKNVGHFLQFSIC